MVTVMMIVALYGMISVAAPRHLFVLVDGNEGDDDDNKANDRG